MSVSVSQGLLSKEDQVKKVLKHMPEGAKYSDALIAYEAVAAASIEMANEGSKWTVRNFGTYDHKHVNGGRDVRNPKDGTLTGEVTKDKHKLKFDPSTNLEIPQP